MGLSRRRRVGWVAKPLKTMIFIGIALLGWGVCCVLLLYQQKLLYKTNQEADPEHSTAYIAERQACSTKWNSDSIYGTGAGNP